MRDIAVRENIKDLILDATDKLLNRYGYQKMTMSSLAEEVGIGKGTLYLHFPSKEELVLSHIDRIVYRLLVKLQIIASGRLPVKEKLREMLIMRVLFRFDSVQHYTESLRDLLADIRSSLSIRHEHHFEQEARFFAEVLKEGKNLDIFEVKDANEVSIALLSATNSLLPYNLIVAELGNRQKVKKSVTVIADILVRGLLKTKA